jgi:hypothetical protein
LITFHLFIIDLQLYLNSNSSNVFYNIAYRSLEETDVNGNRVGNGQQRKMTLGHNLVWSAASGTTNNVSWIGALGTGSATVQDTSGGSFPVDVVVSNKLYSQDTTIVTVSNRTMQVIANTLKVAVNVTGWQAASAANQLRLWIKMSSNQDADLDPNIQPAGTDKQKVHLTANGAYSAQIIFENWAYLQNSTGSFNKYNVTVANTNSQSQNQQYIGLPINVHGGQMWWDPTILTVQNSSAALGHALSLAALLLALFAGVVTLW